MGKLEEEVLKGKKENVAAKEVGTVEDVITDPDELEIENARKAVEELENKSKELSAQITKATEDFQKNYSNLNTKKEKLDDLKQKKFYLENYSLYMDEFSNDIDERIKASQEGHASTGSLVRVLKGAELFKEVCAKKNSEDFSIMSDKISALKALIEEREKVQKTS